MPVKHKPSPNFRWDDDKPLAIVAPQETTKANQALFDYATMGIARSLRGLQARYREQEKEWTAFKSHPATWPQGQPIPEPIPTKSWTVISNWSIQYEWQARVARFDSMEREREVLEFQVERAKMAKKRRLLAEAFFNKTVNALKTLQVTPATITEVTRAFTAAMDQLRAEYGDENGSPIPGGKIKMVQVVLAEHPNGNTGIDVKVQTNQTDIPDEEDDEE